MSLYHSYVVTFCVWSLYFVYGKNKETNKQTPWKSVKIPKVSSLVCGFFFILISCANIFLIPRTSSASWSSISVLDPYSHANRYMSFHQQFFCEVIFCFEKEVTPFYRNYSFVIQEIIIYLLTACNNYSTSFYTPLFISIRNCSLFISNIFSVFKKIQHQQW